MEPETIISLSDEELYKLYSGLRNGLLADGIINEEDNKVIMYGKAIPFYLPYYFKWRNNPNAAVFKELPESNVMTGSYWKGRRWKLEDFYHAYEERMSKIREAIIQFYSQEDDSVTTD